MELSTIRAMVGANESFEMMKHTLKFQWKSSLGESSDEVHKRSLIAGCQNCEPIVNGCSHCEHTGN